MLGVATIALRAAGCSLPQASNAPVSHWTFDETAGGTFADEGPASVPMSLVGSWSDFSTGSLVQGVAGTSAYTNGSAYATLPADAATHNFTALTISFYYQRESASEKHILLAGGDGSEIGDFSIEVLPNGRLRGWHTGQDNQLRFFENTAGVTGTDLQVGTAHRIELTLGAQGARIYLDGAELAAAAIPANTNGWNHGRVKFLGRWTDGAQAPAIGVFDRLRIWNRQLTGAEIAELEAAQSISLPEEPDEPEQPGEALSVPSLAEWLVSDEPTPAATKYVSNQNRGNGSGSSPANAQEVQAALNGAARGQNFIAVCQTPGTIEFWAYPNGLDFPGTLSGSSFITLQAREGDGVVISAGEDFSGARTPNSGFWTQSGLSQTDIDKHIWRSVGTFSGGEQFMMGFWIEFGHPHQLIRAINMTNLRAPYGEADSPTNYAGPMVHKASDGRVYIRMQKPHPVKYSRDDKWSETTFPGHPEAITNGQLDYPKSQDPNDYSISLFRVNTNQIAFDPSTSGHHIRIGAGINSMGFRNAFRGASFIQGGRGLHWTWAHAVESARSGQEKDNYFFNRTRFSDGCKIHAWEWKFGAWQEAIRDAWFEMFNSTAASNIYCKDCTIGHYHELVTGSQNLNGMRFRNCSFVYILDDGFQVRYSMSRVEVGYCYYYYSDWGGMGESGVDGQDADPGEWYIHHNILDCRREKFSNWRAQPHPQDVYTPHSPDGNSPRKIYNNILFCGPDRAEEDGIGFEHSPQSSGSGNNTLNGAANTHQVFNNIILLDFIEGTKRYDPVVTSPNAQYSDILKNRSDFLGNRQNRYSAAHSNELQDYNLYWRNPALNVNGAFRNQRGAGQTVTVYADLAAWFASGEFAHSKLSGVRRPAYTPGWEGNSTMVKPVIGALDDRVNSRFDYRPQATAAVTVAASGSLNGQDWWTTPPTWGDDYFAWDEDGLSLEPDPWKGPLDPSGSSFPVGVQKP